LALGHLGQGNHTFVRSYPWSTLHRKQKAERKAVPRSYFPQGPAEKLDQEPTFEDGKLVGGLMEALRQSGGRGRIFKKRCSGEGGRGVKGNNSLSCNGRVVAKKTNTKGLTIGGIHRINRDHWKGGVPEERKKKKCRPREEFSHIYQRGGKGERHWKKNIAPENEGQYYVKNFGQKKGKGRNRGVGGSVRRKSKFRRSGGNTFSSGFCYR